MIKKVYNLISDNEILEELANGLRNRKIDQKFLYQLNGAKLYYDEKNSNDIYNKDTLKEKDFLNFFQTDFIEKPEEKIALISLGCGNSENESYIFENNINENIDYFGVDASQEMLEFSIDNIMHLKPKAKFICADFATRNFRRELEQITQNYDNRIFAFFSNTFGNINHTNIIDILGNLLKKGEKIWIDVRIRKGTNVQNDIEISNIISQDIHRDEIKYELTETLRSYGFKNDDGDLSLKTTTENSINALKFTFSIDLKNKIEINIKGETIILLPEEEIIVQQIYAYDPDGLVNLFEQHGFDFIKKQTKGYRGQFLFEKK